MLVEAWRQRNQRWAAQHLTPAKSELFQRRWSRVSRFGPVNFSLLAGSALALSYELFLSLSFKLCFPLFSLVTGNLHHGASVSGKGLVLPLSFFNIVLMALHIGIAFAMGILVAATYYFCMREYAKLRPGRAA